VENEAPVAQQQTDTGTQDGTQQGQGQTPAPPDPCICGDCDPGSIDDLTCSAKRYQTQSEIITTSLETITKYRADFTTARTQYQAALDANRAEVGTTRELLDSVINETLLCHVKGQKRECLDQALKQVIECVRKCGGAPGCCAQPCTFDPNRGQQGAAELKGRIEQYRRDVAASATCFEGVLAHISELPTRVGERKGEVAAIKQEAESGTTGKDWARLYARAIVAKWELEDDQVYAGFPRADALVDCLCQALTCIMQGWEAIAVLEGIVAELDCKEAASKDRCGKQRGDMVGEIMCRYDRCCEEKGTPTDSGECDDGEPPPKKPCGCEGTHHEGEQTST
jgi:hypothetical protein